MLSGRDGRPQDGHSLVELSVTVTVLGLVIASAFSLMAAFGRDTGAITAHSDLRREVGIELDRLVIELRQAGGEGSASPIRHLRRGEIEFTADVSDAHHGPEVVRYRVQGCRRRVCDLAVRVSTGPGGASTVLRSSVVISGIAKPTSARPVFVGLDWRSSARRLTRSCGRGDEPTCAIDAVEIVVVPSAATGTPVTFRELVGLRNAT